VNHASGMLGSYSSFLKPRIEKRSRGSLSPFSLIQTGQGDLGRCPAVWKGGPVVAVSSCLMFGRTSLTAALQVTAAEDMTATGEKEARHKALFGVDTI